MPKTLVIFLFIMTIAHRSKPLEDTYLGIPPQLFSAALRGVFHFPSMCSQLQTLLIMLCTGAQQPQRCESMNCVCSHEGRGSHKR